MNKTSTNNSIEKPNFLLIAGNGRNVGKTYLACKIIKKLTEKHTVIGIKISPHFHSTDGKIIIETSDFVITEEIRINKKDSSLMLQAGAEKVFFVMAEQQNLKVAFQALENLLPEKAIVCESGGLHEIINPGLFLFIKNENDKIIKPHLLAYSPIIVENNGREFNFDIQKINYSNHRFTKE